MNVLMKPLPQLLHLDLFVRRLGAIERLVEFVRRYTDVLLVVQQRFGICPEFFKVLAIPIDAAVRIADVVERQIVDDAI